MKELLASSYGIQTLIGTTVFIDSHRELIRQAQPQSVEEADEKTLSAAGTFKNNNAAIAITTIPPEDEYLPLSEDYSLLLEDIRDPGNLGTILRIADWYGIRRIICSPETTDLYSPKVISGSMGSFLRVRFHYAELLPLLTTTTLPVYGTFPENGQSVHELPFAPGGLILLGNESAGISPGLAEQVSQRITIPRYGDAESLNVGIATAIICDNLRRSLSSKAQPQQK